MVSEERVHPSPQIYAAFDPCGCPDVDQERQPKWAVTASSRLWRSSRVPPRCSTAGTPWGGRSTRSAVTTSFTSTRTRVRRGFVSASAGTANALGGANAGFEYGAGPWMFWGQRGGVRTGDDRAPGQGVIYNSRSRMINVDAGGVGRYGEEFFFSVETKYDDGSYGQLRSRESEGLPHLCPAALFASVRGERLQPGRPALSKSLLFSSRIWPPRSAAAYGSRTWSGSFDQIPFPVAPRPSAHLGWPNRCFDRRDSRRSLRW